MSPRIGVVTFPGSLDDHDALRAVRTVGATPVPLWHAHDGLDDVEAVILPGGFSYGDYLRCGAIARFAPLMQEIVRAADKGMPLLGICNGFQVLCESHLLPGALVRNTGMRFTCRDQRLRVETRDTVWTSEFTAGDEITVVLKNGEGNYVADAETLARLEGEDRVVFRYLPSPEDLLPASPYPSGNPNGSANDIAGITNELGNVVGLMPHPEHNVDPLTGPTTDGATIFASVMAHVRALV